MTRRYLAVAVGVVLTAGLLIWGPHGEGVAGRRAHQIVLSRPPS